VIPTKNEEETIGRLLSKLDRMGYNCIVVDDSFDSTVEVARKIMPNGRLNIFRGYGVESPSVALGVTAAEEYVVVMDADGSHPPEVVSELVRAIEEGAEIAVASRYCNGGSRGPCTFYSPLGNMVARAIMGLRTKDITGRFFACRKGVFLTNSSWSGAGEDLLDFFYNVEKKGYNIVEVPYEFKDRVAGNTTKSNLRAIIWRYLRRSIAIRLGISRGAGMNPWKSR